MEETNEKHYENDACKSSCGCLFKYKFPQMTAMG